MYDERIYKEPDGTNWKRIFVHKLPSASNLFSQNDTFTSGVYYSDDKFFELNILGSEPYVSPYEFMVKQQKEIGGVEEKFRWVQDANPMTASRTETNNVIYNTGAGYSLPPYNGGIWNVNNHTYVCYNSGVIEWYGAIGSWEAYNGGIPSFGSRSDTTKGYIELYIKVNHIFDANIYRLLYENTGGTDTFEITADSPWTASTPEWGTLSPLTGDTGITQLSFTVGDWSGTERRRQNLHFVDADAYELDIPVTQKAPQGAGYSSLFMGDYNCDTMYFGEYEIQNIYLGGTEVFSSGPFVGLKVSPKAMSFKKTGGTNSMTIKSSEPWTASTDAEWLTLSQSTGDTGKTTISVTALENDTEEDRNATISVIAGSFSASTDVLQKYSSLPDVPFWFNYNAKQYDATTGIFPKADGQIFDHDLVLVTPCSPQTDGKVVIGTGNYMNWATTSATENIFNRQSGDEFTFIYKAKCTGGNDGNNFFGNRGSVMHNYMVREDVFHTRNSNTLQLHPSQYPCTQYIVVQSDDSAVRKIIETEQEVSTNNISWNGLNPDGVCFFGQYSYGTNAWTGDFYWMYAAPSALTDEEIQEVIDYNENL